MISFIFHEMLNFTISSRLVTMRLVAVLYDVAASFELSFPMMGTH